MSASRNQTVKHITIAAFIFALGLTGASQLFTYVGVDIWQTALQRRQEMMTYKNSIGKETMYAEVKKELELQKTGLQKRLNTLTSGFSDPKDLSALLQTIFDKAWKYNLKFDRTEPQTEKKEGLYTHYPIIFDLKADYTSLAGFVSELERLPHMFHVDRLAIAASKRGDVQAKLLITCFLQPDKGGEKE
ncbi:MAG: type 4a pilus biogenesis protein PilO [Chitinivibrionales bacterium]